MNTMKHLRSALLLMAAFLYCGHGRGVAASALSTWCDDVEICSSEAPCDTSCTNRDVYPSQETTCGDYDSGWVNAHCQDGCGDHVCNGAYEDRDTCPVDCGCGNEICDGPETMYTCPNDCGSCGDHFCSSLETCGNCDDDCGSCFSGGGAPECDKGDTLDEACDGDFCNPGGSCCEGLIFDCRLGYVEDPCCAACTEGESCRPGVNETVICVTKGYGCTGS